MKDPFGIQYFGYLAAIVWTSRNTLPFAMRLQKRKRLLKIFHLLFENFDVGSQASLAYTLGDLTLWRPVFSY